MSDWLRVVIHAGCVVAILAALFPIGGLVNVTRFGCFKTYHWSLGFRVNAYSVRAYLVGGYCVCYAPWFYPVREWGR